MINANELRIGNLVKHNGYFMRVCSINSPKPYKDERYNGKYLIELFDGGGLFDTPIETIDAIPLTEEILLKCGFEFYDYEADEVDDITDEDDGIYLSFKFQPNGKRFYYFCTINPDKSVEFGIKTSWTEDMLLATPEYLHQLQNIYFALTNEELKIDLNNKQ